MSALVITSCDLPGGWRIACEVVPEGANVSPHFRFYRPDGSEFFVAAATAQTILEMVARGEAAAK